MTYNPNIPQAGDIPAQSQLQMLTNFNQANTIFAVDHYAFNEAVPGDRGLHRFIHLEVQAGDAVTTPTQISLYNKNDGIAPNLYYRRANNGSVIKMTANVDPVVAIEGQSFMPGGVILKWGQFHMAANPDTHAFVTGPFPNGCQSVVVCRYGASAAITVSVSAWTAANFTVESTGGATGIVYIALGS